MFSQAKQSLTAAFIDTARDELEEFRRKQVNTQVKHREYSKAKAESKTAKDGRRKKRWKQLCRASLMNLNGEAKATLMG